MYRYGLIGNCQASALIHESGSIDWFCMPRPDSPPVFGKLLDANGGHFSIEPACGYKSSQEYLRNTNVLITRVVCEDGAEYTITDFCPRFYQYGRMYRPAALFRIVALIKGSPQIRVQCRPVDGWSKNPIKAVRGNSHLRFEVAGDSLRLTTNMPLTYLTEDTHFTLKDPLYFGLTWSFAIEEDLVDVSNRFLRQTVDYWNTWVKHCSIPSLYQRETIRSALTLKLHCYEDTGAILAALTTSLPEEKGSERNWDYRFCWLRDAYFMLSAFTHLGHFEEAEGFVKFLLNLAEKHDPTQGEALRPVYRLDQTLPLPELLHENWAGYDLNKPVRSGNQAGEHEQNDVYGEMVLTLAPIFFDERFYNLRTAEHEKMLEKLGRLCAKNTSKPDAGLWELRNRWQEHSFSNLMCWAGLELIHRIQQKGYLQTLGFDAGHAVSKARSAVEAAVKDGVLYNGPKDASPDASLLLLSTLRFPDSELTRKTVDETWKKLRISDDPKLSSFLFRYKRSDDFGVPRSAFLICSFWLVEALAKTGRGSEALELMERLMPAANTLGLFSEHYNPFDHGQAGNFPQAYSHVGQINAAFAVSPPWDQAL